jgi:hypothetical protein
MPDAALRRTRAIELERVRLALRKTARQGDAIDTAAELAWQQLGVPVSALARVRSSLYDLASAALREMPVNEDEAGTIDAIWVVKEALSEAPAEHLLSAVHDLLRAIPGTRSAILACELQAAGFKVFSSSALPAVRCLAEPSLGSVDVSSLCSDWGPRWRRFADLALIITGRSPLDPGGFLSQAPIPAVDAYIETLGEPPHPEWWANRPPDERRYLTARTRPALLDADDLLTLGWWEEYHRRRYLQGLSYQAEEDADSELYRLLDVASHGDISVLDRLAELLPPDNASVIRQLQEGAAPHQWPVEFYEDRGLWLIMARLWAPGKVIDPARSAFHRWVAFRRAYDLTRERSFDAAREQINAFGEPPKVATPFQKEVINLRAYLTMIRSADKGLDEAIALLKGIRRSPQAGKNLAWLRKRKTVMVNEREPAENPYLVLKVAHGAPATGWRRSWMAIRSASKADMDALSAANEARDRILALERDELVDQGRVFMVPLDRQFITPHLIQPSPLLVPKPAPFPSRTDEQRLSAAMDKLRQEALTEFLSDTNTRH